MLGWHGKYSDDPFWRGKLSRASILRNFEKMAGQVPEGWELPPLRQYPVGDPHCAKCWGNGRYPERDAKGDMVSRICECAVMVEAEE